MSTLAARRDGVGGRVETSDARAAAYDEFFRATWPRLFRSALALAGDAASAEDALQSAFAKAYASWGRVSRADHPEAYVRRIVVHEIIGARRYGWGRRERPQERVEPRGTVASPEAEVVERDRLWVAVQALPVRQRAVVVLRYYEDLSEAEIAEVLGCARGTVKSQAAKALAHLRQHGAHLREEDDS